MRSPTWAARSLLVFTLLGGCADPNRSPSNLQFGDSNMLVTGPALRLVTERDRFIPATNDKLPTLCSEPSPDVAVAFGASLAAQGNFSEPSGPTVGANVSAATTEAATALAGRTAGVLALRDGLYAACQSYANGVIGHDAYALILSQYGNLLVALAGTGQSSAPAISAQDAAVSAMLVACVSEWDPTRLSGGATNPLLNPKRCNGLMDAIASGKLLKPQNKPAAAAPSKKSAQTGPLTATTVTAKTVSTYDPPKATN
jgi:hypothetical protein